MSKSWGEWLDNFEAGELKVENIIDILVDWKEDCQSHLEARNKAETELFALKARIRESYIPEEKPEEW